MNGAGQQEGGFNLPNGTQVNQTSQSFPPFGSSNNTTFNTQFTAPSAAGFSFTAGQNVSNNPFATVPSPNPGGFSGSIFNISPAKEKPRSEGKYVADQEATFAAHSPFHHGNQDQAASNQSQFTTFPSSTASAQPSNSGSTGSTLFSQPNMPQPQQTPASIFATPQPATTTADLFAHLKQPEPKSTGNLFGQGASLFQQSSSNQSTSSIFGNSSTPQPSINFGQSSTSTAPEDQTMMSTSPDTSPSAQPSGTSSAANAQPQSSPTKDTSTPGLGGSFFDRISKPPSETETAPPTTQGEASIAEQASSSIFDRMTKPSNDTPSASPAIQDSGNLFKLPPKLDAPSHVQASTADSQPAKKKLFGNPFPPQSAQPSPSATPSMFLPVKIPNFAQSDSASNEKKDIPQAQASAIPNTGNNTDIIPNKKRKFGTVPDAPDDFSEEERAQLVTGYRLKSLDTGMRKRLRTEMSGTEKKLLKNFYAERVGAIHTAKGGPLDGPAPGNKRQAPDEQHVNEAQGKKVRLESSPQFSKSPLSNGTGPASSQTSSLFRNILGGNNQDAATNSASTINSKSADATAPELMLVSQFSQGNTTSSVFESRKPSSSLTPQPPQNTIESPFKGFAPVNNGLQASGKADNIFGVPKDTDTAPSLAAPKPSSSINEVFNMQTRSSNMFSFTGDQTIPKPTGPPGSSLPKFDAGKPTDFMAQFGQAAQKFAAETKAKRKLEEYDSDEDEEGDWDRKDEEEQRAKRKKLEDDAKRKVPKMINGKFEWVTVGQDDGDATKSSQEKPTNSSPSILQQPHNHLTNGHNIFGHLSGEESGAEGSKTGDADDEDDDNDGHDGEEEEDEDQQNDNDDERDEEIEEDEEDEEEDDQETTQKATGNPFDARLSRPASPPRNSPSLSIFDRISKDANGNPVREVPKPDDKSSASATSIFGQSPPNFGAQKSISSGFATSNFFGQPTTKSSSSSDEKPLFGASQGLFGKLPSSTPSQNAFGKLPSTTAPEPDKTDESPKGDHTWKADSPIKFGAQSDAPPVSITAPSPSKSSFTGLFGAPKSNAAADSPAKLIFTPFGTTPTKPAGSSLGFGFTPANAATNSLVPPSNTASGATSRATSPGATTGESANESAADKDEDHFPKEEQVDLTSGGPGEEDEDVIFDVKAKALNYDVQNKVWATKGLGPFRVMKHRETGNARILMRQDPSGKIVVNAALLKGLNYESTHPKTVRVPVAKEGGGIENLTLKVGKDDDAKKLASVLSENKPV